MKTLTKLLLNIKSVAVLAMCLSVFSIAQAQSLKIGYVSTERVMRESGPVKAAEAKMEAEYGKRQKELRDMQIRLKNMAESLDKDMPVLAESDRIKRQRELYELDQDFQRKQRAFREDLNQRRNEEMAIVVDRANKAIKKIAETEKYDLIVQDVVYINPKLDITDQVLKAIGK